jgi:hypothetical protein
VRVLLSTPAGDRLTDLVDDLVRLLPGDAELVERQLCR